MANKNYLNEDGSLDIERINKLPLKEFMDTMGDLTQEQVEEYLSKQPINESKEPMRVVKVDYTLEEELKRGSVIAKDYINNMRERLKKKFPKKQTEKFGGSKKSS